MKKYLFMLFTMTLFCIFLLMLCGSPIMAAPQSETDDETGDETETPSFSGYEFTVERGFLLLPDGVKLAVSYWMPAAKKPGEKFPVFFEMNGYRKDDLCYLSWDYPVGAYFARHGYVVAKVDLRGTGDSGGMIPEVEYSEQELSDGVEIINQLSKKEWSNGKVGMYGLSWGAFNSLMVARRKPPALKAILIAHASDDLYYQDVHFIDGVMHTDVWEAMIDTYNALPDTKAYALTPEFFTNRFDRPPWHFKWKKNLSDGPFWRKESARFHPAMELPVYIIGGLLDGYRDTVVRLLNSPNKRVKAEIGPWKHEWPNTGSPGPNYEWRKKALRWWDHWLKGIDNGIMKEPRFMVFVRDGVPPSEDIVVSPGKWRCGNWPIEGIKERRLYPGEGGRLISTAPGKTKPYTLVYKAGAGTGVHGWWGETSGDMSPDDESSLVFDSEPLKESVEIIGLPKVNLTVSADAPLYQWSIRLEDVWPDGQVSLVSGTLINPADRESRLKQRPLVPGEKTRIAGEIHFTTWRFKPKHRIRLSISNAQFPMAWPTPYKGATTLYPGAETSIELPVVERNTLTAACDLPRPEREEWPPDASYDEEDEGKSTYIDYNPETGAAVYSCGINQRMTIRDTEYHMREKNTWNVNDNDPAHATYKAETTYDISLPGREIRLIGIFDVASDEKAFNLTVTRRLFENGKIIREKKWTELVPRNNQ